MAVSAVSLMTWLPEDLRLTAGEEGKRGNTVDLAVTPTSLAATGQSPNSRLRARKPENGT